MNSIVCFGESTEVRESNKHKEFVNDLLNTYKSSISDWSKIVLLYEPKWAIGTGKVATIDQLNEMFTFVREWLTENANEEIANTTRIIYGGSVTKENCKKLIEG